MPCRDLQVKVNNSVIEIFRSLFHLSNIRHSGQSFVKSSSSLEFKFKDLLGEKRSAFVACWQIIKAKKE
jgi:hypothetical protein